MSTPKSGWIARDGDGELHWYDREPEWIAPGECIQIGTVGAVKQARETGGAVHVEGATVYFPEADEDTLYEEDPVDLQYPSHRITLVRKTKYDAVRAELERVRAENERLRNDAARLISDVKAERIQINSDTYSDSYSGMPYTDNPGSTHWEGCYRTRGHHNCAVRQVYRLQDELERVRAERDVVVESNKMMMDELRQIRGQLADQNFVIDRLTAERDRALSLLNEALEIERLRKASHALAMASLQSQRYFDEPEYRQAVDDVLELTKARATLGEDES